MSGCRGEAAAGHVTGGGKLTQLGAGTVTLVVEDIEVRNGMVMPALYAMRARRYIYERGVSIDLLAQVSVKARRHGAMNPFAQFRQPTSVEEVVASRMIADPITLLQCCPKGDGAAAVIVVNNALSKRLTSPTVEISGSVLHSGTPRSEERRVGKECVSTCRSRWMP